MQSLFPVAMCCISLLHFLQQPLALPVTKSHARNRFHALQIVDVPVENENPSSGTFPAYENSLMIMAKPKNWKHRLGIKAENLRIFKEGRNRLHHQNDIPNLDGMDIEKQKVSRGRRHAHPGSRGHHPQLMRVGCVLGTCQVQNLSHRLWQLIGQSGREDSSPVNPRSPHSYG
ncbi:protein ADM2 [Polypterus senegalus]|nr:protein ADM2 [Polypterus senegalus]